MLPSNITEEQLARCDVYLSICKPLGEMCPGYSDSTTCQKVTLTNGTAYYYDMGTYDGNDEFLPFSSKYVTNQQGLSLLIKVLGDHIC